MPQWLSCQRFSIDPALYILLATHIGQVMRCLVLCNIFLKSKFITLPQEFREGSSRSIRSLMTGISRVLQTIMSQSCRFLRRNPSYFRQTYHKDFYRRAGSLWVQEFVKGERRGAWIMQVLTQSSRAWSPICKVTTEVNTCHELWRGEDHLQIVILAWFFFHRQLISKYKKMKNVRGWPFE